ncbi:MAG: hypothetical protein Q8K30_01635 [Candidatus Gracilibacteria bacterium]|nr:hypothetical protein [Candidatus Gracilibacteria bacterium]
MKKTEEKMNKNFLIKMENIEIKTMFTDGKIWLTKREIANIYGTTKTQIKKEISNLLSDRKKELKNSIKKIYNIEKDKTQTYYNLDILMILGYRTKHFKETKLLINTNQILKDYTKKRQYRTSKYSILSMFLNYFG